jgi:hypothetical protein
MYWDKAFNERTGFFFMGIFRRLVLDFVPVMGTVSVLVGKR